MDNGVKAIASIMHPQMGLYKIQLIPVESSINVIDNENGMEVIRKTRMERTYG